MKKVLKVIRDLLIFILVLCILLVSFITVNGHNMYKNALAKVSLANKVAEIRLDKNYTKIENMPAIYTKAVIAVEDHRFKVHNGIDLIATARAVMNNMLAFDIVEGGSTITQQLGKNLYFTQEKHFTRKVAELFVAFDLEKNYSKDEILELYINTIYFGDGYYGVKEAAKGYFNKEPKDLTDYEATILAGIPNAPSVYALTKNPQLAIQRQKKVLKAMIEHEYLSENEAQKILNNE